MVFSPTACGSNTRFNDALEARMRNCWDNLSPKTVRDYERIYRTTIRGAVGQQRIAATNSCQVEFFLRSLSETGLGASDVRQVRAILSRSCRLTSKWSGGEGPNAVATAEIPKLKVPPTPVWAPSVSEVKGIIEAAQAGGYVRMSCLFVYLQRQPRDSQKPARFVSLISTRPRHCSASTRAWGKGLHVVVVPPFHPGGPESHFGRSSVREACQTTNMLVSTSAGHGGCRRRFLLSA